MGHGGVADKETMRFDTRADTAVVSAKRCRAQVDVLLPSILQRGSAGSSQAQIGCVQCPVSGSPSSRARPRDVRLAHVVANALWEWARSVTIAASDRPSVPRASWTDAGGWRAAHECFASVRRSGRLSRFHGGLHDVRQETRAQSLLGVPVV